MIDEANKGWSADTTRVMADRPDGDVDLDSDKIKEFRVLYSEILNSVKCLLHCQYF